ncbi:hypothetical protein A5642_20395 [Mycolicibacterium mucogenicum]|uniref:Uncharacterized protein n=1 Tax=Mycolicibacterium mucogenicum TaxID=56689 RepID=A0A1A0MR49_MYCMU|nr:hypothetical protein A5642_20395 [Mycolicibacterium mucogenicum]
MQARRDERIARLVARELDIVGRQHSIFGFHQHFDAELLGDVCQIDLLVERLEHQDKLRIGCLD